MKRLALSCLVVGALCAPAAATATFIDHTTYSTDTVTHLDWLDLTATAGLALSDVQGGAGGWLAQGWHIANTSQLDDLFARYVGTPPENLSAVGFAPAVSLIRQLGVSVSFNNNEGVQRIYGAGLPNQISLDGYFDDGTRNPHVGIAELVAILPSPVGGNPALTSRWVVYPDFWQSPTTSAGTGYGTYLVRAASIATVPEPAPFALLGAGLVSLLAARRKSRRASRCADAS